MRILIVEDEPTLGKQLKSTLEQTGYAVDLSVDGEDGHFMGSTEEYDAVILDLGLPEIDGLTVLGMWRKEGRRFPVLVLTARDSWSDKVAGLDAGADDYLAKPFEPKELLLRINAILRRSPAPAVPTSVPKILNLGPVRYDVERAEMWKGEAMIRLTATETALMRIFSAKPGEPVSRIELVEDLGRAGAPGDGAQERAVDVQITRLRRKLEEDPKQPRYLQTVRGAGYMLAPD